MATIVTRTGKGSALTFAEGDANFTNLNTDKVELTDISVTTGASADTSALAYNNSTGVFTFTPVETGNLAALDDISVTTGAPSGAGALAYNNTTGVFTFQAADLTLLDFAALDDFSVTTASASGAGSLSYNNTTGVFTFAPADVSALPFIASLDEDTTPQLGGSLDVNNNSITTTVTDGNITITANGDGEVVLGPLSNLGKIISFSEEIETLAAVSGTLSIDATEGPIKYVVPSGAMTINGLASPVDGQTVTMLIDNATNTTNYGITLGAGLLTPAGDGVTVTNSGYDLVTITCVDSANGVYVVTAINDFQ
jgi:hypothetical protein